MGITATKLKGEGGVGRGRGGGGGWEGKTVCATATKLGCDSVRMPTVYVDGHAMQMLCH